MWMGSPLFTRSVASSLRKSCGMKQAVRKPPLSCAIGSELLAGCCSLGVLRLLCTKVIGQAGSWCAAVSFGVVCTVVVIFFGGPTLGVRGVLVHSWLSAAAAGDVQYRPPVTPDGVAGALAEAEADLVVEALAFPVGHGDVAGKRVEQLDLTVGVVGLLPVEVPGVHHLEQAARLDLSRLIRQLTRAGPDAAGWQPFADLVVDVLDLAEERVAAVGKHVKRV